MWSALMTHQSHSCGDALAAGRDEEVSAWETEVEGAMREMVSKWTKRIGLVVKIGCDL